MANDVSRAAGLKSKRVIIVDETGHARTGPTPERVAQACASEEDAVREIITEVQDRDRDVVRRAATVRLLDGDPLELLYARKTITQVQYACGLEFHRHWMESGLASVGVPDLARPKVDGGQHKPQSDVALWHLGVFVEMVRTLGKVHARILNHCILGQKSLESYGLRHGPYKNPKQARDWATARFVGALEQLEIDMLGERQKRRSSYLQPDARPANPEGAPAQRLVEAGRGRKSDAGGAE